MAKLSLQKQILGLIGWLFVCFIASALGAMASIQATPFYAQLIQPDWAPPAWLFGPVWTVLYIMMGIAAWLVWRYDGFRTYKLALIFFLLQLAANALWSWLFFAWHLGALALIDISVLIVLIIATIITFWRVQPLAGALLLPYLLWVCFASVLNYSLWQFNSQILS